MKEEINPYEERMKTFFDDKFGDDYYDDFDDSNVNDGNIGRFYTLDADNGILADNI